MHITSYHTSHIKQHTEFQDKPSLYYAMPLHPYYNALASQGIDHSLAMLTLLAHRPLMQTSYPTKKAKGSCSSQVNAIVGIVVSKRSKSKSQKKKKKKQD